MHPPHLGSLNDRCWLEALTRPLAYVISNSPNLELRLERPNSQFSAFGTTFVKIEK